MRLPIRFKMFALVALVLVLAISAVIWKTSGTFQEDKTLFVKEFADRFTGTVARLTVDRVQSLQNSTATFVSNRESLKNVNQENIGKVLFERFPEAYAVALVDKSSGSWAPVWVEKNKESTAKSWTAGYENTLVRSLNFDATDAAGLFLTKLTQSNGQPAFALGFAASLGDASGQGAGKKSILVSILSAAPFEDIIKDFKGDINEVFIIDQRGYVYAHPDPQFMNKNLESHPLVDEIRKVGKEGATGMYEDMESQSIIGSYRKVRGTNLYVVSTTPTKSAFKAAEVLIRSVVVFGIGFGLIGVVIAIFVAGRITNPLNRLKSIAAKIGSGDFRTPVDVIANDEVGELATSIDKMKVSLLEREEALEHSKMALIQSEKMSAFGQLSAGIAHEVKNPLAGILGHAQLAKGKITDPDLKKHIEVIEKETRRTKEIVENLMKFARAEKADLSPTNLYEAVSGACDLVDHQLTLMGVKIIKKLSTNTQTVKANSNQLQQVLLNIMMNAGHAMEKSSTKELTVFLEDAKDCVRIRIQDTGSGMTPEVQKRIFEPFFTTKPAGKGTGLGLSVSIGIVRDHNGKIYVQSEVGKGSTFFIDIPLMSGAAQIEPTKTASAPTPPPTSASTEPRLESIVSAIPKEETAITVATRVLETPAPPSPAGSFEAYTDKTPPPASSKLVNKLVQPSASEDVPLSPFGKLPTNGKSAKMTPPAASTPSVVKKVDEAPKPPPLDTAKPAPKPATVETSRTLGGKTPIAADIGLPSIAGLEPDSVSAASISFVSPHPMAAPPITKEAKPVEPPPAPESKEMGYEQKKQPSEEFKVSIRRPKLKV